MEQNKGGEKLEELLRKVTEISKQLQDENTELDENANEKTNKRKGRKKTATSSKLMQFNQSPEFMELPLKDFQVDGLNWMVKIYENGFNGILADEMGLGKTIQTIALLGYFYYYKNIEGKHLIFGPKSVINNWKMEFERFCPNFKVVEFVGSANERKEIAQNYVLPRKFDVLLANYEVLALELSILRRIEWKFVIIDEGHRMKNENSQFSKNIRSLCDNLG